MDADNMTLDRN